jgi:pyruvate dehydrogenase E1 component alpha subunit
MARRSRKSAEKTVKAAGPKGKKKSSASKKAAGGASSALPGDQLLSFYREMLLIRRFEEKSGQMYGMGLIGGFCHLYIGEEAVIVGMRSVMSPRDSMITAYRDHGHALAVGEDPKAVMAELMGRQGGSSKGKGGSMHLYRPEANFYGGHGIVGASVPIGVGVAFAHKYRDDGGICLTFFGDGAANQGQVYEACNMAALWSLPVLFVIENNRYGMGTSVERASAITDLYRHGAAFNIPGHQVDGMDVEKVIEAGREAVEHCRAGKGPIILEMLTYRYRGHSMSDPAKYRSREEVSKMRAEHDPIDQVRKRLLDAGQATEESLRDIDREIKAKVTEAAEYAQNSPEPEPAELYTDVLAEAGT